MVRSCYCLEKIFLHPKSIERSLDKISSCQKTRFNIAAWLAQQFIESRIVPILIIGLLLFGLLGLFLTPREENPQIIVPAAEVIVTLPGAPPLEVEHLLLTPLEGRLSAIDGVKQA
ncbi:hypothetical protein PN36_14945 [Candidatus Thiomargarita nelsonii]|uniref:Acriflavin resistance protein n=1 Tax=Candidatus Thiomargarita nelsonii TaxID=1003181 RepID=A0A0A6PFW5_9GAMM|nr:hypothetical protein PN36_14945 [Candidatus Thiomargarita nelsonii]